MVEFNFGFMVIILMLVYFWFEFIDNSLLVEFVDISSFNFLFCVKIMMSERVIK